VTQNLYFLRQEQQEDWLRQARGSPLLELEGCKVHADNGKVSR
jgi:hypothetical protein